MIHPACLAIDELLRDCRIERTRRSGPGGQHRNKVETAVVVHHQPSGISGEASERRSQEQNRKQAVFRLRMQLALQIRTTPPSDPTTLWKSRTADGRLRVNAQHDDFPALVAEALNRLSVEEWQLRPTTEFLGVSVSQLTKFLKTDGSVFAFVNNERQRAGLHALR